MRAQAGGCATVQEMVGALQGGWKHQGAPSPSYHLLCLAAECLPGMAATREGFSPLPPHSQSPPVLSQDEKVDPRNQECQQLLLLPEHEEQLVS